MKNRRFSRFLSIVLLVAMVLTLMPATALAAGTVTTWEQVALADITADDTIAITMNAGGTYYVLPTNGAGSSGQPLATETGTVSGTTLSTEAGASAVGWKISAIEGGYSIATESGSKLYITNANNGVRIGSTDAVWNLDSTGAYLSAPDSAATGTTRYLGVYSSSGSAVDWRCYTNVTGNITDQTVGFWKLSGTVESEAHRGHLPAEVRRGSRGRRQGRDPLSRRQPGQAPPPPAPSSWARPPLPSRRDRPHRTRRWPYMIHHPSEGVYTFELDGKFPTSAPHRQRPELCRGRHQHPGPVDPGAAGRRHLVCEERGRQLQRQLQPGAGVLQRLHHLWPEGQRRL